MTFLLALAGLAVTRWACRRADRSGVVRCKGTRERGRLQHAAPAVRQSYPDFALSLTGRRAHKEWVPTRSFTRAVGSPVRGAGDLDTSAYTHSASRHTSLAELASCVSTEGPSLGSPLSREQSPNGGPSAFPLRQLVSPKEETEPCELRTTIGDKR